MRASCDVVGMSSWLLSYACNNVGCIHGCLCTNYVIAVVVGLHLSLRADGKDAFEDIPMSDVCRPACHDSSLYLFVLVIFLDAVVLSRVYVAFDIFYQHIVHVYWWGVICNHHF